MRLFKLRRASTESTSCFANESSERTLQSRATPKNELQPASSHPPACRHLSQALAPPALLAHSKLRKPNFKLQKPHTTRYTAYNPTSPRNYSTTTTPLAPAPAPELALFPLPGDADPAVGVPRSRPVEVVGAVERVMDPRRFEEAEEEEEREGGGFEEGEAMGVDSRERRG